MKHRQDPIMQQLFGLAKDIFGTDIEEYKNLLVVLQQVCNQTNSQVFKANKRLLEDVENPESRKRSTKCLDNGILYANEIYRKYHITAEPLNPSLNSLSVGPSLSFTSSCDFLPASEHKNLNWAFIDSVRKLLKDKTDWEYFFSKLENILVSLAVTTVLKVHTFVPSLARNKSYFFLLPTYFI